MFTVSNSISPGIVDVSGGSFGTGGAGSGNAGNNGSQGKAGQIIRFDGTFRRWSFVNSETMDFAGRIKAASGTVSDQSLIFVDQFVTECKIAGVWDRLKEVGVFVGSSIDPTDLTGPFEAAKVKLKYPSGSGVLTTSNFVNSDFNEGSGFTGNGTKYFDTGLNASNLPDSGHMSFYLRDDLFSGLRAFLGAKSSTNEYWLGSVNSAATQDFRYANQVTASNGAALGKGFYVGNRESSTAIKLYKNGSLVNTGPTTNVNPQTKPNGNIYVFAYNDVGVGAAGAFAASGSFYSYGDSLDGTQTLKLYNAVQRLQAHLNRAV